MTAEEIRRITGEAVVVARANASIKGKPLTLAPVKPYKDRWTSPHEKNPFDVAIQEKLALLRRHRIAAWDVLASCTREGAADSTIRETSPNDIPGLLARHPGSDAARELLNSEGALALLEDEQERLLVRKARLEAERTETPFPGVIPGIVPGNAASTLIATERVILDVRNDSLARELEAVEDQKALITAEIETLEAKQIALTRQQDLAQREMDNVETLAERGLVANARLFEVERMLVTVENQALDVSTALLEARQNLATTESDRISLLDTRLADILTERQLVDAELAEIERKITTQRALSSQLLTIARTTSYPATPEVQILIRRQGEVLPGTGAEPLLPGDIVNVVLPGTVVN
ncbi:MAG: hypothetical protein HC844_20905 [Tabrizicola sp.]|nr:hypothetical protein [Tabrizicola sp.]